MSRPEDIVTQVDHSPSGPRRRATAQIDGKDHLLCTGCDNWLLLTSFYRAANGYPNMPCRECTRSIRQAATRERATARVVQSIDYLWQCLMAIVEGIDNARRVRAACAASPQMPLLDSQCACGGFHA